MRKPVGRTFNYKSLMAGLVLVLGLTATGCSKAADPAQTAPPAETNTVEAYGVVQSAAVFDVVLDFPASVETLHVREGQKVGKDQAIATLDLSDYKLQMDAKAIELRISGNEKTKILSETTVGLADDPAYLKLKDALALAVTALSQAEKDYQNAKTLLASGAMAQTEHDQLKLAFEQKRNAKTNLEKDIAQYEKSKGSVSSAVGIKDLQAASGSLALEHMRAKLETAVIKGNQIVSPFESAVVYDLGYEEGALIGSAKKFCTLADLDQLIIEADVTEDFIAEVKLGSAVTIVPVADRTKVYSGKVTRIADMAKVENGETLVGIEVSITDNDGFLKPNYNVDLSIEK